MDKIQKALQKLNNKDRNQVKQILEQLFAGNFSNFDIKKLKGKEDIFRVRKGDFRIIYRVEKQKIFILAIERRRENTYRF